MTVSELIEELKKLDQSLPVVVYDYKHDEFELAKLDSALGVDICKSGNPTWWSPAEEVTEQEASTMGTQTLAWLY